MYAQCQRSATETQAQVNHICAYSGALNTRSGYEAVYAQSGEGGVEEDT